MGYAPHGAGKNLTVSVYLGNGAVTKPRKLIDYKHPVITSIEPNHGPGSGDTGIVRIVATELGDLLDNENITMKVNGGVAKLQKFNRTVTIGGKPCKIVKVTKNTIECKVPKGIGYDLPVVISVEGEDSPPGIYSYDGPSVLNVVPSVVPAAGGERITVIGTSFGEKTASAAMEVIVGGKVCKNATWVNDTSISCVSPPGIGKSRPVVVVVKGQPTSGRAWSKASQAANPWKELWEAREPPIDHCWPEVHQSDLLQRHARRLCIARSESGQI